VNDEALTVDAFIASLNVTVTAVFTGTFDAPFDGVEETTDGAVRSLCATVVNVALNGTSALPATSVIPALAAIV
jgi:hypothetical protein